ncbi:helix-turn-helix domain-containing protein [Microbacterium testaceum]|uniref:helix-turn-helix domain-containing protein n=1 Tax=Microbacterium testaceum TaxID=2033 RepID=UPI001D1751CE|nr:helix-turn-helix transcriptional regulator [Microbacterium testaceum]MCC4249531.1 helix-turn-helix transcriptional regulator [Microbacterium testaceum]
MQPNRNGFTDLDAGVAAEVRSDIARMKNVSVSSIAEALGIRRATLSARVNAHVPFAPSLLSAVAAHLGTTASEIVARAERALAEGERESEMARAS